MRVYIAGPMSWVPHFNFPAFREAAEQLRAQGYDVTSPQEMDSEETQRVAAASLTGDPAELPPGNTWGEALARDVKLLADGDIEAVVVLPGWERSRGARLETYVAYLEGLPVLKLDSLRDVPVAHLTAAWVGEALVGA